MKKGNVVIWHIGRCGSTVLSSVLNQHPNINCLGEVFNPLMDVKESGEDIPDIDSFFSNLVNNEPSKSRIIEVKFLESQHLTIYNQKLSDLILKLKEIGYDKYVVLERKNYLKRMISHCVAQETKIYHIEKNKTPELHKIHINTQAIKVGKETRSLLEWFSIFSSSYSNLRSNLTGEPNIELQYENDIQLDVKKAYHKVCSFINTEGSTIEIPYARTNPFKMKDVVINFSEVEELLIRNGYSWMLEDTIPSTPQSEF